MLAVPAPATASAVSGASRDAKSATLPQATTDATLTSDSQSPTAEGIVFDETLDVVLSELPVAEGDVTVHPLPTEDESTSELVDLSSVEADDVKKSNVTSVFENDATLHPIDVVSIRSAQIRALVSPEDTESAQEELPVAPTLVVPATEVPPELKPSSPALGPNGELASAPLDSPLPRDLNVMEQQPQMTERTTPVSSRDAAPITTKIATSLVAEQTAIAEPAIDGSSTSMPQDTALAADVAGDVRSESAFQFVSATNDVAVSLTESSNSVASSELKTLITNQVTDHIVAAKHSSIDGESQLEVVLDPPELGKIKIELTSKTDQLHAKLVITDHATLDAIRESLPKLFDSLAEAGISLEGFQLESSASENGEKPDAGQTSLGSIATSEDQQPLIGELVSSRSSVNILV